MDFPTDIIKHVEIIRGPGCLLYGSNTFAVVLNVITKSAEDIKSSSISYGGGTNSSNIQKFQAALNEEEFQMVLYSFRRQSSGWYFSTSTAHPSPSTLTVSVNTDYA